MIVSSTSLKFSASYNELDLRSKRTRSQTVFSFDTGKLDTWLLAKNSTLQIANRGTQHWQTCKSVKRSINSWQAEQGRRKLNCSPPATSIEDAHSRMRWSFVCYWTAAAETIESGCQSAGCRRESHFHSCRKSSLHCREDRLLRANISSSTACLLRLRELLTNPEFNCFRLNSIVGRQSGAKGQISQQSAELAGKRDSGSKCSLVSTNSRPSSRPSGAMNDGVPKKLLQTRPFHSLSSVLASQHHHCCPNRSAICVFAALSHTEFLSKLSNPRSFLFQSVEDSKQHAVLSLFHHCLTCVSSVSPLFSTAATAIGTAPRDDAPTEAGRGFGAKSLQVLAITRSIE